MMNLGFSLNESKTNKSPSQEITYDILVIGGGPAGINAALYGARKGRSVALLTKRIGGQLLNTNLVENYLGFEALSGEDLSEKFRTHLEIYDVPLLEDANVTLIEKNDYGFTVTLSDLSQYHGKTLITSLGSNPRKLNVPGEKEYSNRGVAYCAICDAPLYKGKQVLLAGGGNSAVEAAIDVAMVASSVTLIHRSQLRADQVLIDRMMENPKISVYLETQILEVVGNDALTGVRVLDKKTNQERIISGDGLFIEIGNDPNTMLLKSLLNMNEKQEVIVDEKGQSTCPGLYACGDMTNRPYKQIIMAAADGASAALAANEYLNTH
jgi:alkyl hydroperoxide reductase subunit F